MNKIPALLLVGLLLSGCTDQPRTLPVPAKSLDASANDGPSRAELRSIEVYGAVLRGLIMKDHTFGRGRSPFDRVYVLDGAVPNGARWGKMWKIAHPFSEEVRKGLREELRALPPIHFISGARAQRMGDKGMDAGIKGMGVILSVGSIDGHGSRVEVWNSLWCGGLCGQWTTYVLRSSDGRWRITGTTGPMAIS